MQKLKHIVNWVVWSLIFINVLLMTLTHLPVFQEWLGERVAHALGQQLGTSVSIERLDLGFFNRVIVDGLQVDDQQQRRLLDVGRMSLRVDLLPLAEGRVVISSVQLFNARATLLRRDSLSAPNYQFIVDSLSSSDTISHTPLNLSVNSLIVRRSSVSYDQLDVKPTPGIINPAHLKVSDISAHVLLPALTDDSVRLNVKRLALQEQSGLKLSRMSLLFEKHRHGACMTHLFVQLPRSSLIIDSLKAQCDWSRLKSTLRFRGILSDCSLTPADFTFMMPRLAGVRTPVSINARLSGTGDELTAEHVCLLTGDGSLKALLGGRYYHADKQSEWRVKIDHLSATEDFFNLLMNTIDGLPEQLNLLTHVRLNGEAMSHADGSIDGRGQLISNLGRVKVEGSMSSNHFFNGHLDAEGLQLGQVLADDDLGAVNVKANLSGNRDVLSMEGNIGLLEYRGYTYQDMAVDGTYSPASGDVGGKVRIDDPYLKARVEGSLQHDKVYTIKVQGDITQLKPSALKLSDRWGDAVFSTKLDANFSAAELNDAKGFMTIRNFVMRDSAMTYSINHLGIQSGYEDDAHYLRLNGDMGSAELKGRFDWETLPQSIFNYVGDKLPTLPDLPPVSHKNDNAFDIRLNLTDSRWLKYLLGVDLELQKPLSLHASIDDVSHKLDVDGRMPRFAYNDSQYDGGSIRIISPGDTMKCEIEVARLSEDEQRRMDFGLKATAAHNAITTMLCWDNHQQQDGCVNGMLNARTTLYLNDARKSEARIDVLPSNVTMGETQWEVEPGVIIYNSDRLVADHLSVVHNQQHIIVDGVVSASQTDTMTVDLRGVEVAYILDLVGFTAVSFAGQATGKAFVCGTFDIPDAWTDLRVEHFMFEGGRMGTLDAHARWNHQQKQIDIHAIADDGEDAKTYIDGYVSPVYERIDLAIRGRGTYIDFLKTYTNSFLDNVTGNAVGDLRLTGPLGEMDLLGRLVVDARATVTALGTTYTLTKDTVDFIHNDILLHDAIATDKHQNTALLNGGIHHDHLSALTFDLSVSTDKLLAYDQGSDNGDLFHGVVIASGNVEIIGRSGEVIINCNATPLAGTVFTYNAATPDAITDQRFITWTSTERAQDTIDENSRSLFIPPLPIRTDPGTDLRMNFLVNVTPEATLRLLMDAKTDDYITLAGDGVIRATYYDKGAFQMFGTYTVDHGTYGITIQNIIKKNFTFQQGGTIVFGGAPFDAALNLQAMYTVNGVSLSDLNIGNSFSNTVRVNCLMNISGQAGAPQVEFDLDMPTVNSEEKLMIRSVITSEQEMNQQVLYLLGIGRFYTQGTNNANSQQQQYGQSQLAMQSFLSGTLSTQINEVLSQVLKTSNWNFGANISTGNEGWHNAEYEGMVSGRMLNNRLLINGQFGYRDNATQASPSFIGDFDIRYLLHPNGNLALKVYNQTNDRYFTRSSLNTQGVGIIMKKDFNGLGDLFRHRRRTNSK